MESTAWPTATANPEYYTPLWISIAPVLMIFGTIGNALTLVMILSRKALRISPWAVYLVLLAIADLLVLYTGLLGRILLVTADVNIFAVSDLACKFGYFFMFFSEQMESWIIVHLSVERLVGVYRPLLYTRLYTRSRAGLGVAITAVLLMFANIHWYWMYGVQVTTESSRCDVIDAEKYQSYLFVWVWLDLVLSSLLPFVLMLGINAAIIVQLKCRSTGSHPMNAMTVTLILVTLTFLFLTAPMVIYTATNPDPVNVVLRDTFQVMNFANYAINFVLYCVTAPKFRKEFLSICSRSIHPA